MMASQVLTLARSRTILHFPHLLRAIRFVNFLYLHEALNLVNFPSYLYLYYVNISK